MTHFFIRPLATDARALVELEGRLLERYAVMLQLRIEGQWKTVRLLDNARGRGAIRYLTDHWEAIAGLWKS